MGERNRTNNNRGSLRFHEWVRFEDAIEALRTKFSFSDGGKFILENWDCKYIDMRLDIRTGAVYIKPDNGG